MDREESRLAAAYRKHLAVQWTKGKISIHNNRIIWTRISIASYMTMKSSRGDHYISIGAIPLCQFVLMMKL